MRRREGKTKKKIAVRSGIAYNIFVISLLLILLFVPRYNSFKTTIKIEVPETFKIRFLNYENNTEWESDFLIYRIMLAGCIENTDIDNDNISDIVNGDYGNYFDYNFVDQTLLNYYFDIFNWAMLKEYILTGEPVLNGRVLSFEIIRNSSSKIGLGAFDLSVLNETVLQDFFDFGNDIIVELVDGIVNTIEIEGIDCYKINTTHYLPYLNLIINGVLISEKMAWNSTIGVDLSINGKYFL